MITSTSEVTKRILLPHVAKVNRPARISGFGRSDLGRPWEEALNLTDSRSFVMGHAEHILVS